MVSNLTGVVILVSLVTFGVANRGEYEPEQPNVQTNRPRNEQGEQSCSIVKPSTPCRQSLVNVIEHVLNFIQDFPTVCWGAEGCPSQPEEPENIPIYMPSPIPTTTSSAPSTTTTTTTPEPTNDTTTTTEASSTSTTTTTTTEAPTTTESEPTVPEPCQHANDLAIVIDSSLSIGRANFAVGNKFVADLSLAFTEHENNRITVMYFADKAKMLIPLDNGKSSDEIATKITNAPYRAGYTNTGAGMQMATDELKAKGRGVPQNMIVFTDGNFNRGEDPILAGQRARKNHNIGTFAVGIGSDVDYQELVDIAGDASRVHSVAGYEDLTYIMNAISKELCP